MIPKVSDVVMENKAGYTVTPVACGWAGAIFEVTKHLGRSGEAKKTKKPKKVKCDRRTDAHCCESVIMDA